MAADLVAIAEPVTKWATRVFGPVLALACATPGHQNSCYSADGACVCLSADGYLDALNDEVVATSFPVTRVAPEPEQIAQAAQMLAVAQKPMIIMGDGVAASAQAELTRVAELTGAEVWCGLRKST